ncbi:2-keto-4-pentenoate hydratase/2-oxohepta-3-ene-1,7-dioic acid hydratase in catechol pathway [Sinobaca qinghaiensis]|uniref:2-keto-4-pentenoate hydratase/2-oxohepta-3-ene-1,7-dioic acid hydratase in catechol pathway n=1 Tax=Sinobaca qinghaiensis TaxID=342944 RepID=A0A419V8D0_9BACL|nr:fumarylacetoacetate hydrolase family protein [Sinobaca qinghaiensis]RKD76290.1 2-keto-4-pentenoate hydratase/2-oxohepta-3-ene-1,7-dioic acid hydratase in catechol pathway [Sinobaca qinghaiensis]
MMTTIKNIYCVGRNYTEHVSELNNAMPEAPMLFLKPTHAFVEADGREIELPGDKGAVHFEAELVIRIGKPYEKGMSADELIDGLGLGLDFTLRDVQSTLKEKGHPWLRAKGFPASAPVTPFIEFPGVESLKSMDFTLVKNGTEAQRGNIQQMIFDLQHIIDYTAESFGLGEGDLIFTGTPKGVGPVADGDTFSLRLGDNVLGGCRTALK